MYQRWIGPIMVFLILGGVAAVLVLNLNLRGLNQRAPIAPKPHANVSINRRLIAWTVELGNCS